MSPYYNGPRGGSYTMASSLVGDLTDDNGNLLLGAGLSAATSGLGPAIRRYIMSGVYNGDFALTPPYPDSTIVEAWNPLPFWTFVQASGTSITAQSVEDSGSGSGRILRFSMAAGAAGDDSYFEQIVPINGTRSQSFAYLPQAAFHADAPGSHARAYISAAYITGDGTTVTGTEAVGETWTSDISASPVYEIATAGAGSTISHVPSDAYFLRLRVGLRRATAATSAVETLDLYEVRNTAGDSFTIIADRTEPTVYSFGRLKQDGGVLHLIANSFAPGAGQSEPILQLNGRSTIPTILLNSGALVYTPTTAQTLVAGTTISPNASYVRITATAPVTITAAPTVTSGTDGQILTIVNVGSNAITVQDQGTLASSNLRLSTATFAIGARDNITLMYSSDVGDWIEISRTNVI